MIRRTRISPYLDRKERAAATTGVWAARAVAVAASMAILRLLRRAGVDHLVEDDNAVTHLVEAVVGQRRVAVLVDAVGAQDALAVLRLEHLVDDRLAVVAVHAGALDRVEHELHRLVAVDRVRVRAPLVVRLPD